MTLEKSAQNKSEKTRIKILENCITCIVQLGFEGGSLSRFGKAADVDPALIFHYFKSKNGLIQAMVEYNGLVGKSTTTKFMEERTDVENPIERYVRATFDWLRKSPSHAGFFIFILLRASYDPFFNKFVWKHFEGSRLRVATLLTSLLEQKSLERDEAAVLQLASELHSILLGNLLLAHAEGSVRLDHYEKQAVTCLFSLLERFDR